MSEALSIGLTATPAERRDYLPLLRWLILMGIVAFGIAALAYFGLLQLMLETDRTHISVLILVIFALTSLHCLVQTFAVSRELAAARRSAAFLEGGGNPVQLVKGGGPDGAERSVLTRHIAQLVAKAERQGGGRLDQAILLRSLADNLRGRERLGWFVAESLLRLALLGTAVGFILMLIPIAGLSSFDVEILRDALAGMSGGMAVALNITVAGITCALILKVEYYLLNEAVAELFALITETTEVHVVSALERPEHGR